MEPTAAIFRVEVTSTLKMEAVVSFERFVTAYLGEATQKAVIYRVNSLQKFYCCHEQICCKESIDLLLSFLRGDWNRDLN
jgi:hypothetical protein